jgi:hypothetical protein
MRIGARAVDVMRKPHTRARVSIDMYLNVVETGGFGEKPGNDVAMQRAWLIQSVA